MYKSSVKSSYILCLQVIVKNKRRMQINYQNLTLKNNGRVSTRKQAIKMFLELRNYHGLFI